MDILNPIGILQNTGSFVSYSAPQVALNIFYALILSIMTSLVYQLTHRSYSYSKNFAASLILVCLISTLVIMVIGNSLARAFALLGTFSIIRFRTAVKDSRDISFIFLSLVIGMAVGTNNYTIAIVGTILILLIILALDKINITGAQQTKYTLSVFVKDNTKGINLELFNKYLKYKNLISISTRENGRLTEHLFAVDFRKAIDKSEFIEKMSKIPNIEKVNLFSTKEELEY